jgi:hypothetical protein
MPKKQTCGVPAIPGLPQWDCPRVAKSPFLSPSFDLLKTIAAILKEQLIKHKHIFYYTIKPPSRSSHSKRDFVYTRLHQGCIAQMTTSRSTPNGSSFPSIASLDA